MQNKQALTAVDVIILIIMAVVLMWAFLATCSAPGHQKIRNRIVCGINLKGLGTAMTVYAHDYDDNYPQLPGKGLWSRELGFDYDMRSPDFRQGGAQANTARNITASWYLLVREADVSPKSFVCPASTQRPFDGTNPARLDITELWDFGPDPYKHVSYSLHNPYGKHPATAASGANFATAADMNPWFRNGDIIPPGIGGSSPQIIKVEDSKTWSLGNSCNHPPVKKTLFGRRQIKGPAEAQNVVYADGHSVYEKFTNCGSNRDNIYTFWSKEDDPTAQDTQGGTNPTSRSAENDAKSKDDSFLAI